MIQLAERFGIRPWEYHLVDSSLIQNLAIYNYAYPPDQQDGI